MNACKHGAKLKIAYGNASYSGHALCFGQAGQAQARPPLPL